MAGAETLLKVRAEARAVVQLQAEVDLLPRVAGLTTTILLKYRAQPVALATPRGLTPAFLKDLTVTIIVQMAQGRACRMLLRRAATGAARGRQNSKTRPT
jgi:hypothetical protein